MQEKFLIHSLPRSRSAWLAAFLSDGECVCGHDVLEGGERALRTFFKRQTPGILGSCETSFYLKPHDWNYWIKYKHITILRNPNEIFESLKKIQDEKIRRYFADVKMEHIDKIYEELKEFTKKHGGLVVNFKNLDNSLLKIKDFISEGKWSNDHGRLRLYKKLNIQITITEWQRLLCFG